LTIYENLKVWRRNTKFLAFLSSLNSANLKTAEEVRNSLSDIGMPLSTVDKVSLKDIQGVFKVGREKGLVEEPEQGKYRLTSEGSALIQKVKEISGFLE